MSGPTAADRDWPRLHALLEQYTPDGWLGRLLLGVTSGSVSGILLFLALYGLVTFTLLSVPGGLLALAGGVATGVLTVVTLWPVYLSIIGNVESADEYAPPAAAGRTGSVFEGRSSDATATAATADAPDDDPVALLKHRYAAGELSDDEFERRLDRLLNADERGGASAEPDRPDRDRVAEPER